MIYKKHEIVSQYTKKGKLVYTVVPFHKNEKPEEFDTMKEAKEYVDQLIQQEKEEN